MNDGAQEIQRIDKKELKVLEGAIQGVSETVASRLLKKISGRYYEQEGFNLGIDCIGEINEEGELSLEVYKTGNDGRRERERILKLAKNGEEVNGLDLDNYIKVAEERRGILLKGGWGRFSLEKGESGVGQRRKELLEVTGIEWIMRQGFWKDEYGGEFVEEIWGAIKKLREGVDISDLTNGEYNALVFLKTFDDLKANEENKRGALESFVGFQETLVDYEIVVESVLSNEGIRFKDGLSAGEKVIDLDSLSKRSRGRIEEKALVDLKFDLDEAEKANNTNEVERLKKLIEKKEESIEELKEVELGRLMGELEVVQLGIVANAFLDTDVDSFLNPEAVGVSDFPVRKQSHGLEFININSDDTKDVIGRGIKAAGLWKKWESIGSLEAVIKGVREGAHEVFQPKEAFSTWLASEGATMIVWLMEIPGVAEAITSGALTGMRHKDTGTPVMPYFEQREEDGKIILRQPSGDDEFDRVEYFSMNGEIRQNLKKVLRARFEKEGKGGEFRDSAVEIAYSLMWALSEGVQVPWTLNKIREGERIVHKGIGAAFELFFDWSEELMVQLDDEENKNNPNWKPGTAQKKTMEIMRWLTPAFIPAGTYLTEVAGKMSINPLSQDAIYSLAWGEYPAYDEPSSEEREIRDKVLKALNFIGPFKGIDKKLKNDIRLRERRRWQGYFWWKVSSSALKMKRADRVLFNVKNPVHLNKLHIDLNSKSLVKDKLKWLGFGDDDNRKIIVEKKDIQGLFSEIDGDLVQDLANEVQKWFGWKATINQEDVENLSRDEKVKFKKFINGELFDEKKTNGEDWPKKIREDFKKYSDLAKLELVLRGHDFWGVEADFKGKGWIELKSKLIDLAIRFQGTLSAAEYKWLYNYGGYKAWAQNLNDWPHLSGNRGVAKGLELVHTFLNEYGRRSPDGPHVKDSFVWMHQMYELLDDINKERSAIEEVLSPESRMGLFEDYKDFYPGDGVDISWIAVRAKNTFNKKLLGGAGRDRDMPVFGSGDRADPEENTIARRRMMYMFQAIRAKVNDEKMVIGIMEQIEHNKDVSQKTIDTMVEDDNFADRRLPTVQKIKEWESEVKELGFSGERRERFLNNKLYLWRRNIENDLRMKVDSQIWNRLLQKFYSLEDRGLTFNAIEDDVNKNGFLKMFEPSGSNIYAFLMEIGWNEDLMDIYFHRKNLTDEMRSLIAMEKFGKPYIALAEESGKQQEIINLFNNASGWVDNVELIRSVKKKLGVNLKNGANALSIEKSLASGSKIDTLDELSVEEQRALDKRTELAFGSSKKFTDLNARQQWMVVFGVDGDFGLHELMGWIKDYEPTSLIGEYEENKIRIWEVDDEREWLRRGWVQKVGTHRMAESFQKGMMEYAIIERQLQRQQIDSIRMAGFGRYMSLSYVYYEVFYGPDRYALNKLNWNPQSEKEITEPILDEKDAKRKGALVTLLKKSVSSRVAFRGGVLTEAYDLYAREWWKEKVAAESKGEQMMPLRNYLFYKMNINSYERACQEWFVNGYRLLAEGIYGQTYRAHVKSALRSGAVDMKGLRSKLDGEVLAGKMGANEAKEILDYYKNEYDSYLKSAIEAIYPPLGSKIFRRGEAKPSKEQYSTRKKEGRERLWVTPVEWLLGQEYKIPIPLVGDVLGKNTTLGHLRNATVMAGFGGWVGFGGWGGFGVAVVVWVGAGVISGINSGIKNHIHGLLDKETEKIAKEEKDANERYKALSETRIRDYILRTAGPIMNDIRKLTVMAGKTK